MNTYTGEIAEIPTGVLLREWSRNQGYPEDAFTRIDRLPEKQCRYCGGTGSIRKQKLGSIRFKPCRCTKT